MALPSHKLIQTIFSAGNMRLVLKNGLIVRPDDIHDEPLGIDTRRGRILDSDQFAGAHVVDVRGYAIYPGLINAHDHLELNHYPRTRFRESYANAHEWGEDVSARLDGSPFRELRRFPLKDRCLIGGLKNILSGVTTVAHHNQLHRPLRSSNFPVNVVRDFGWAHSLHFTAHEVIVKRHKASAPHPFIIHLAEGTDDVASRELDQLAVLNLLDNRSRLVHGVGLTESQTGQAIEAGAGLIWCPSSNFYLLGETAAVEPWFATGQIALGSDSRLTADGDLLDELRFAHALNVCTPQELFKMVTSHPNTLLKLDGVGDLQPGTNADLIILPRRENPYDELIHAHRADLQLVMRNGQVVIGEPEFVSKLGTGKCEAVTLDGQPKLMARSLVRRVRRSQLQEPGLDVSN